MPRTGPSMLATNAPSPSDRVWLFRVVQSLGLSWIFPATSRMSTSDAPPAFTFQSISFHRSV